MKFKKGDIVLDLRDNTVRTILIVGKIHAGPVDINDPDHIGIWDYLLSGGFSGILADKKDIVPYGKGAKVLYAK